MEADLEAERVAGAEADGGGAVLGQRVPDGGRVLGGEQQLDAVLAGVAGAGDRGCSGAPATVVRRGPEPLRQLAVGELLDERARVRALDGEHRVVVELVLDGDVEVRGVLLEPREVLLVVARVRDGEEVLGAEAVAEQVVEDAAVVLGEHAVLRAVLGDLAHVVGEDALEERLRIRARCVSISPMWLTSNTPTFVRTATCSARIPAYCTGISHPANGTSRAPAAAWRSCSGVRFSVSVPAAIAAGP